ncbi:hypothetical protein EIN_334330 [Entamoeba invadens IP1]|uniref:Uncharacterized protein n=1 Tax=Entamoeba invadens IP1 TaxID=370355 RepID=A0A0A1UB75_ENTIV|nr:hypothetical protein EIN_334330 [Entamoeba invadens IP1]ELP92436.1 hypothetical protein EIN_334330 [Entamoeba invadens IP1]|eukprot:XP_004259207.1 hypothetical protein EIN_334330 [Entamoeba invadens IP1]
MSDPFNDTTQPQQNTSGDKSLTCSVLVLAILSTVFGWVGATIIFFLEKRNVFIRATCLHCIIITAPLFLLTLFLLIFYWAGMFFIVTFWIFFVICILVNITLVALAVWKSSSEDFLGIPLLDKWIVSKV